jgi:tetratricopeptide (TPR) repeat protein
MAKNRAFVGHSFTAEDSIVVGKFLRYFDAIKEINSDFFWEHAERAEPSAIDEKVLRLFEDKNVFIGICTRKERVISPAHLTRNTFKRDHLNGKQEDFHWKTSDWIIQEIGLAFGRGLQVIILLEEGVRTPGGIQGSLEYIEFNRDSPEASFGKVLQMVASISLPNNGVGTVEASLTVEPLGELGASGSDDWLMPNHTWGRGRYELAFMHHVAIGDSSGAGEVARAYLESPIASPAEAISWEAFSEYTRLNFSSGGNLEKIKELVQANPSNPGPLEYLARSYKAFNEPVKAANTFVLAAEVEFSAGNKIELLGEAIECLTSKDSVRSEQLLVKIKEIARGNELLEQAVLAIENTFSKNRSEDDFGFSAMERLLEREPDNHSRRFELAYAYSEASMNDMALLHYSRIPYGARDDMAWNNLGVAYGNARLPVKSVDAFKKAKNMGNTLAMANLANRLIEAGFLDEARAICSEAATVPEHHKNVDSAMARVKGVQDAELDTEKKIMSSAEGVSDFYREVGAALLDQSTQDLSGQWIHEGVALKVSIEGTSFSAGGIAEENVYGLRRLALMDNKSEKFEVLMNGIVRGRAIHGTYEKKRHASPVVPTLLASDNKEKLLMYVSLDGASIEVLRAKGAELKTQRMQRISEHLLNGELDDERTA